MMKRWTYGHPTEPGKYWFYGWRGCPDPERNGRKPELVFVDVRRENRGGFEFMTYEADGGIFAVAFGHGRWQSVELPSVPDLGLFDYGAYLDAESESPPGDRYGAGIDRLAHAVTDKGAAHGNQIQ